jgi:hypothetical protein
MAFDRSLMPNSHGRAQTKIATSEILRLGISLT